MKEPFASKLHKLWFLTALITGAALKLTWRASSLQFLLFSKPCSFFTALEISLSISACLSGWESRGGGEGGGCKLAQAKSSLGRKPQEGRPCQLELVTRPGVEGDGDHKRTCLRCRAGSNQDLAWVTDGCLLYYKKEGRAMMVPKSSAKTSWHRHESCQDGIRQACWLCL